MDGRLDNKLGTNVDHTWKKGILETIIWDCLFRYHKHPLKGQLIAFYPSQIFPHFTDLMEHIQLSFVVEIEYQPPPKSQSMTLENYEFHFDDSPIEVSGVC